MLDLKELETSLRQEFPTEELGIRMEILIKGYPTGINMTMVSQLSLPEALETEANKILVQGLVEEINKYLESLKGD